MELTVLYLPYFYIHVFTIFKRFFKFRYLFSSFNDFIYILNFDFHYTKFPRYLFSCNCGSYFISILISIFYMKLYSINLLEYSDILLIFYIPLIDGLRVTVTRVIEGKNLQRRFISLTSHGKK